MIEQISPELITAFEMWFNRKQWIHRERAYDDEMILTRLSDLSQSEFIDFIYGFAHQGGGIQSGGHRTSGKLREALQARYHEFRDYLLEPLHENFKVESWLDRVSQFKYWGPGIATIYLCRVNRERFTVVNDKSIKALSLLGVKKPTTALSAKYHAILNAQTKLLEAYPSLDNYQRVDALFHFIVDEGGRDLLPKTTLESRETSAKFSITTESNVILKSLILAKNLVLEGVPGTGKTYAIKREICEAWPTPHTLKGRGAGAYAITLHPATSYEDFVEGLRPSAPQGAVTEGAKTPGPRLAPQSAAVSPQGTSSDVLLGVDCLAHRYFHVQRGEDESTPSSTSHSFMIQDGFFLRICAEAVNNPHSQYVVLLDEINRCNVPKVMGDLLTTLERSKRARWCDLEELEDVEELEGLEGYWDLSNCQVVTLPNSRRLFFVPENVYVVATMNTTDRSVAPLDAALRRRFAFQRLWPKGFEGHDVALTLNQVIQVWSELAESDDESAIGELLGPQSPHSESASKVFSTALRAWGMLNLKLKCRGPDAMLGHSYLFDLADDLTDASLSAPSFEREVMLHHWNHHLLPQLIDLAVTNHFEGELIGDEDGSLTHDLFKGSGFVLESALPSGTGLLAIPTLTLKIAPVAIAHEDQES